ncbi:MAG: hypothetical protein LBV69_02600 [Bacteroidales bacterium]|jgi:hypothetical protein|nr:hypothetical protein [Bacteroidales bacterium]
MEISSIVLGIVITLGVIVLVWLLASSGKRKSKKNFISLCEKLKEKSVHITEYEQINNFFIGIDVENKILVYLKDNFGDTTPELFELKNVLSCNNDIPKDRNNVDEDLHIILIPKNSSAKIKLECYYANLGLSSKKEIIFLEKWTEKINSVINK